MAPYIFDLNEMGESYNDEPDIGKFALLLAKEAYPDLDIDKYLKMLDKMAEDIKNLVKGNENPDYRIRAINTYLFKIQGFHYDKDDLFGRKLKNRYLNGLLDTKSGSCTTLPLLYLVVAQKLGYPIYPVIAPQHVFCRYVDLKYPIENIEAAGMGGSVSDKEYVYVLEIPEKGIKSGSYLRTMTLKEYAGDLIIENGTYWLRNGEIEKGIQYIRTGLFMTPTSAEAYRILSVAYLNLQKKLKNVIINSQIVNSPIQVSRRGEQLALLRVDLVSEILTAESRDVMQKAEELGVAPVEETNYWIKQTKRQDEYKFKKDNEIDIKKKEVPL